MEKNAQFTQQDTTCLGWTNSHGPTATPAHQLLEWASLGNTNWYSSLGQVFPVTSLEGSVRERCNEELFGSR